MTITYIGDTLPAPAKKPRKRRLQDITAIVVHRFGGWAGGQWIYPETTAEAKRLHIPWRPGLAGVSYDDSPLGVARFYGEIFGWRHPYPIQVYQGVAYQTSPLDVITRHAGRFNRACLGVLITGDHRDSPPLELDLEVCAAALAEFCRVKRWNPSAHVRLGGRMVTRVLGHDEGPPGITATPGKQCPGDGLDMNLFRELVADHLSRLRDESLAGAGFVLTF